MKVINIGRKAGNDVIIRDEAASRYHLQIVEFDDGTYHLIDFGSLNGTYVNGLRIDKEVVLDENDFVRIGDTMLPWKTYFSPDFVSQAQEDMGDLGPTQERKAKRPKLHPLLQVCLLMVGIGSLLWLLNQLFLFGREVYWLVDYPAYIPWSYMVIWVLRMVATLVLGVGAIVLLAKRSKVGFIMMAAAAVVLLILLMVNLIDGYFTWRIAIRLVAILLAIGLPCGFLALKKENMSGWKNIFG